MKARRTKGKAKHRRKDGEEVRTPTKPGTATLQPTEVDRLAAMQGTHGNRYVQRLIRETRATTAAAPSSLQRKTPGETAAAAEHSGPAVGSARAIWEERVVSPLDKAYEAVDKAYEAAEEKAKGDKPNLKLAERLLLHALAGVETLEDMYKSSDKALAWDLHGLYRFLSTQHGLVYRLMLGISKTPEEDIAWVRRQLDHNGRYLGGFYKDIGGKIG